jgi:hypothetical protein
MKARENNSSSPAMGDAPEIAVEQRATFDPALSEEQALALLAHGDLTASVLEKMGKHPVSKRRKVALALIAQLRTPRHIALSLLRNLFTFDLMGVALIPAVAADIKIASEESLIRRLEKLSVGEKLSLARRASARVIGALVKEADARVVNVALESSRLTEAMVVESLVRFDSSELLAQAVCRHPKWAIRPEIQRALERRAERLSQNDDSGEASAESNS